jgi:hypothetical protein
MGRAVFRAVLPANDQWHMLSLSGPIVHVGTRGEDYVEVWFIEDSDGTPTERAFRVVGTGHSLAPALAHHIGTAVTPSGRLVWHVFEHARTEASDA